MEQTHQSPHPQWALSHKKQGTELRCINNRYYLYEYKTVYDPARIADILYEYGGSYITRNNTRGQNMMEHPHLHCIIPAGRLSFDKGQWVHTRKKNGFFIYYKVLSEKFRGKFLDILQTAYNKGNIDFGGTLACISGKGAFTSFKQKLFGMDWVVNIQKPLGKPEKILEYLSRYVFRIAITDRRIIEVKDGKVLFSWKDYRSNCFREMNLDIDEFIRRFLLHVLLRGFYKVRYYGIFSSRYRRQNIELAKSLPKYLQNHAHPYLMLH